MHDIRKPNTNDACHYSASEATVGDSQRLTSRQAFIREQETFTTCLSTTKGRCV